MNKLISIFNLIKKAMKSTSTFFCFNISFFILTNFALFIFSLTRGGIGGINFLLFLLVNILILLVYILINKKFKYILLDILFLAFMVLNYILVFISLVFLKEAIDMNYSLSKISFNLIPFFIENMLGFKKFFACLGVLLAIILLSIYIAKEKNLSLKIKKPVKRGILVAVFSIILIILITTFLSSAIYNPYIRFFTPNEKQIEISLENVLTEAPVLIYNNNLKDYNFDKRKYPYVFVFVMEQTSLDDFYEEKALIKKGEDFFERVKSNTHFFNNYYNSNQDSRTAVWEMLNSFFIPMECYIEPWQEYYGYILNTNNLIEYLVNNGISPYAVSSVGTGSLIFGIYPFKEFIKLEEYEESDKIYLCSTQFSYQKGCEDFAIFEDFTAHILENKEKDLFYFQEMIFGHGEKYMSISGKERVEYYSDYFNAFYDFLETEELLDQSLIMIVSDHGVKGGGPRDPSDFNLPLMVISKDLEYQEVNIYYSHFSFKDIFLSYYLNNSMPEEEKIIYLIDQTGRDRIGYVNVAQGFSILGKIKGEIFSVNENDIKGINIMEVQEKMKYLKEYEKYIIKLSLENNTYVHIP